MEYEIASNKDPKIQESLDPLLNIFKNFATTLCKKYLRLKKYLEKCKEGYKPDLKLTTGEQLPKVFMKETAAKLHGLWIEDVLKFKKQELQATDDQLNNVSSDFTEKAIAAMNSMPFKLKGKNGLSLGNIKDAANFLEEFIVKTMNSELFDYTQVSIVSLRTESDRVERTQRNAVQREEVGTRKGTRGEKKGIGKLRNSCSINLLCERTIPERILKIISKGEKWIPYRPLTDREAHIRAQTERWAINREKTACLLEERTQGKELEKFWERSATEWQRFQKKINSFYKPPSSPNFTSNIPNYNRTQKALQWLSDHDYIVLPSDKNLGLTIMDRSWYHQQILSHLISDNYEKVADLDTLSANSLSSKINRMLKRHNMPIKNMPACVDWCRKVFKGNMTIPTFYVLPKIHKANIGIRPIVPAINSITTDFSLLCNKMFEKVIHLFPWILKDSIQLINEVEEHRVRIPVSQNIKPLLVTIDVVNMYGNIINNEGIARVKNLLLHVHRHNQHIDISDREIHFKMDLWKWVLEHNYFIYDDQVWRQILGCAMGTNGAPYYAVLALANLEIQNFKSLPKFWKRYIDDIFCIWTEGQDKFLKFISWLNSLSPSFQFTYSFSETEIAYLDVMVSIEQNPSPVSNDNIQYLEFKLKVAPYEKPFNNHLYTHPSTFYPDNYKYNWIQSEFRRLIRNSTDEDMYNQKAELFKLNLLKRGYVLKIITTQKDMVQFSNRKTYLKDLVPKTFTYILKVENDIFRDYCLQSWKSILKSIFSDFILLKTQIEGTIVPVTLKGFNLSNLARQQNRGCLFRALMAQEKAMSNGNAQRVTYTINDPTAQTEKH
jgi:hypothetical protein